MAIGKQVLTLTVQDAAKMLQGLAKSVQSVRDAGTKEIQNKAKELAAELEIESDFAVKRRRKVKRLPSELADDEGNTLDADQLFVKECNAVYDSILSHIKWRFQKLEEVASDFLFLDGHVLMSSSVDVLQKYAADLALKYRDDLNAVELLSEVESFKFQAASVLTDLAKSSPVDLLTFIHKYSLQDVYPNIEIALRLFLSLPVTVASCERSFSKLKLIKNYLRSSIGQERLSGLAIISIESTIANELNYDDVIDSFALLKARKVHLK